jgi:hypothetical protein
MGMNAGAKRRPAGVNDSRDPSMGIFPAPIFFLSRKRKKMLKPYVLVEWVSTGESTYSQSEPLIAVKWSRFEPDQSATRNSTGRVQTALDSVGSMWNSPAPTALSRIAFVNGSV